MSVQFIEKAKIKHGDKYNYSKVVYINSKEKVIITCKEHGEFLQTSDSHLRGYGCKKCAANLRGINYRSNNDEFIKNVKLKHGNKYDYSKVEYINSTENVIIICKEHGEFPQLPPNHLKGS
jgi:hypothetical protein